MWLARGALYKIDRQAAAQVEEPRRTPSGIIILTTRQRFRTKKSAATYSFQFGEAFLMSFSELCHYDPSSSALHGRRFKRLQLSR